MSQATTCGGCDTRWHQAGNRTGHCSACHRTFSGISTFDAHQRLVDGAVACLDPWDLLDKNGNRRFKSFIDQHGATVWRSALDRPEASWASAS